jgi:hypothetical protein
LRNFRFSSGTEVPPIISRTSLVTADAAEPVAGQAGLLPERADFVSSLALPVASTRLSQPPSRQVADAVARSNASVLGFLLHEVDLEAMPRPAEERLATALAPLRIKLDLLIDLVARLSYRDIALPPVSPVELGPTHIAWHSEKECRRGDWLRLDLYFHQVFREPVSLFAAVTDCDEPNGEQRYCIAANLFEMADNLRERLVRLAFLTQRQQQARQRQRTTAMGKQ